MSQWRTTGQEGVGSKYGRMTILETVGEGGGEEGGTQGEKERDKQ